MFAVVPTFNRWAFTADCIAALKGQSYRNLTIIVSDGGSTDGTRDRLAVEHPDVIVAYDAAERWWAGSTALGISEALGRADDDDYVLLINNDTLIGPDYLEILVSVSASTGAAVGAMVCDSRDPALVLDAGEYIDWDRYDFPVKTSIGPGEEFCDDVDVLPGRGSLVPIHMIRKVGNVDDRAFPHYLADYDFFCRIKAAGFRIGVSYRTAILAHIEETGLVASAKRTGFGTIYRELTSRRSMTNVRDHLRFASRHAPPERRAALRRLIVRRAVGRVLFATPLEPMSRPILGGYRSGRSILGILRRIWRDRDQPNARLHANSLPRFLRFPIHIAALPRPIHADEIMSCGHEAADLVETGLLQPLPRPGWFMLRSLDPKDHPDADLVQRLTHITVPLSTAKIRQVLAYVRSARA